MPARPGCRRAYHRFYLRGRAILQRDETYLGVYTADASRQGICFLSPVQLLPKERCRIRLPNTKDFQIEVVRCRRIGRELLRVRRDVRAWGRPTKRNSKSRVGLSSSRNCWSQIRCLSFAIS